MIVPIVVAINAMKMVTNMASSTSFKVCEAIILPSGKVISKDNWAGVPFTAAVMGRNSITSVNSPFASVTAFFMLSKPPSAGSSEWKARRFSAGHTP